MALAARAMVGTPSSAWRRWNAPVRPERNAEEGCAALADQPEPQAEAPPLLLCGNRGGLELVVGPAKLSGAAHGIGLKQAAIVLGTILGNAQRGCVDATPATAPTAKGTAPATTVSLTDENGSVAAYITTGAARPIPQEKSGKDCSLCCIRRSHELSPSSSTQIASFSWLRERR